MRIFISCCYHSISFDSHTHIRFVWVRHANRSAHKMLLLLLLAAVVQLQRPYPFRSSPLASLSHFFFLHTTNTSILPVCLIFRHSAGDVIIANCYIAVVVVNDSKGMTDGLLVYCVKMWWQDDDMISSLTCNILMVCIRSFVHCIMPVVVVVVVIVKFAGSDVSWIKLSFFNLSD